MAVTKRTRYEVLRRDNHTCQYCGERAPDVTLHIDHVIPVSLGGSDDPSNLVAACKDCNLGKASSSPDAPIVQHLSDRAADYAMKARQTVALLRADLEEFADYAYEFEDAWKAWSTVGTDKPIPKPADWRSSLMTWWKAGLPIEVVQDAVSIAMSARNVSSDSTFRYFAGVIYNKLDEYELQVSVRGIPEVEIYTEGDVEKRTQEAWSMGFESGREVTAEQHRERIISGKLIECHIDGREIPDMLRVVV